MKPIRKDIWNPRRSLLVTVHRISLQALEYSSASLATMRALTPHRPRGLRFGEKNPLRSPLVQGLTRGSQGWFNLVRIHEVGYPAISSLSYTTFTSSAAFTFSFALVTHSLLVTA